MKPPFDIAADLDTPVSAYLKLKPFRPRFLLESVEGGERLARYSFIGFGDCSELRLDERGLTVDGRTEPAPATKQGLLDAFRRALAHAPQPTPRIPGVPLAGGLVGVAGYDLVRRFERLPSRAAACDGTPEVHYLAPRSLLVFDHLTRGVALLHAGSESEREALRREVIRALRGGVPATSKRARYSPPVGSLSEAEFIQGVHRTKEYIAAGDVYQLVLSVRFSGQCELEPFETYRALRLLNPSPYMYFCDLGDRVVVGSSPEALVKLSNGLAQMRPIAGTRPRGADAAEDARLQEELLADPKENAEHVMLVDLARNDLGRVAKAGSVHVDPYRSIERYSHVMHIVSEVNGRLRDGLSCADVLRATFPAGTVSGAPKIRALEVIRELEPIKRNVYAGSIGYIGWHGDADTAIAIRTAVIQGGRLYVQAGAGIVHDSDPGKEWDETMNKGRALFRAVAEAARGL